MTALYITLIIVGGVVLVSLAGIAWLWSVTAREGGLPFRRTEEGVVQRLNTLESQVRELREEVDKLRGQGS